MNYIVSEKELLEYWEPEQVAQILSHGNPIELIAEGEVVINHLNEAVIEIYHTENAFRHLHKLMASYQGKSISIYIEVKNNV